MNKASDPVAHVKKIRSMWGRFLLLTLPVLGIIMLSGYFLFQSEQQAHMDTTRLETAHHIESQADNIREEIMQAVLHVKFLAKHSEVVDVLEGADGHTQGELSQDFYLFAKYMGVYDQVRLLDSHGFEVVRANFKNGQSTLTAKESLQDKSAYAYFRQTIDMPSDFVFISKFTLNVEQGRIEQPYKPVIRYASPVINEEGANVGVVVLNFLGDVLIKRYLDATDVSGENMLLNANGYFIHAADERLTWGELIEQRKHSNLEALFPGVWKSIVEQRNGQILGEHGLFTFATISPYALINQEVPKQGGADDWIIVSYVSCDELNARTGKVSLAFITLSLFLLCAWIVLAWLWVNSEEKREKVYHKLQTLHESKRYLLRSQMSIQEEERRALARSLHDDMGQSLTSIQAYAAGIGKAVIDGDCERVKVDIHHIRGITTHIQQSVRTHLHDLRPASLDSLGLGAAIEDMLDEFSRRESIACD
ncbi:MAG: histidine kinase, partial [Mariprofundus sp.]|nr:histidine kinase [Mariprofundus sp.]